MINHARTLLMNTDVPYHSGYIAEEIVDPLYHVRTLPSYLQQVRSVLFGTRPDRSFLNYRCRQYMNLLHATELEEFVLELDPRITYDFDNTDILSDTSLFDVHVKQLSGAANELFVSGNVTPPDRTGQMLYEWLVVSAGANTDVTLLNPYTQTTVPTTFSSGLSDLLPLIGSGLSVRRYDAAGTWKVRYLAKPQRDLGEILVALDSLNSTALLELFNVGNAAGAAEPFKTFRNLWNGHYALPYRLGGLLLAVIYQTDALV